MYSLRLKLRNYDRSISRVNRHLHRGNNQAFSVSMLFENRQHTRGRAVAGGSVHRACSGRVAGHIYDSRCRHASHTHNAEPHAEADGRDET